MQKAGLLLTIIFLLSFLSVRALTIECFDDGSMQIEGLDKKWPVYAKDSSGRYYELPGDYSVFKIIQEKKYYSFRSDEALLVSQESAQHSIKFGKSTRTITCPPFKFSCRIFNVTVDYCYNRGDFFTAKFMVHNFHFDKTNVLRFTQPTLLKYEVQTKDNRKLVHAPKVMSPEFRSINITLRKLNSGNKFIFEWPTDRNVKRFFIRYDECSDAKYNLYKSADCTEAAICTVNKDCFEDEYCENWTCKKMDCGKCQYIEEHICMDHECCSDGECLQEQKCKDHSCTEFECKGNERVFNHTCVELDCPEDRVAANHSCQKLNCAADEKAVNHTCTKLACRGDEIAKEHACRKLVCAGDEFAEEHYCKKLECSSFQKSWNHKCVNYFVFIYKRLFD